ncbi:hypothetical protein OPT61_g6299 [Boeremia exigua]|uniref:Uncharacterized protein n=1 Tax=Boeremia exigua TaxID=749465 RepID=A0ACC2I785_9PLEO|nr:hypothetical protein OPT61_g6299 [Boeremia exigua]
MALISNRPTTAETRRGLLLALERFLKKERNGANSDRAGFLERVEDAIRHSVISAEDPQFRHVLAQLRDEFKDRINKKSRRRAKVVYRRSLPILCDDASSSRPIVRQRTLDQQPAHTGRESTEEVPAPAPRTLKDKHSRISSPSDHSQAAKVGEDVSSNEDGAGRSSPAAATTKRQDRPPTSPNRPRASGTATSKKRAKTPFEFLESLRRRARGRKFVLKPGYNRITKESVVKLYPRKAQWLKCTIYNACDDCLADAYHDVHFREEIDKSAFQRLLLYIKSLEPWTYTQDVPARVREQVMKLPFQYQNLCNEQQMAAREAQRHVHGNCTHSPKCFPPTSTPNLSDEEIMEENATVIKNAMREQHGVCGPCKLDMPVHLGNPTYEYQSLATYSIYGRVDGAQVNGQQAATWITRISSPDQWFSVFQRHCAQIHQGITRGNEIWAGMAEVQYPFWSSLEQMPAALKDTHGTKNEGSLH